MANKTILQFNVDFLADGTSTTLSVNLTSGPVIYATGDGDVLNAGLSVSLASASYGLYCAPGGTTTQTGLALGVLDVSFSTAPPAGIQTLGGYLVFG